MLTSLVYQEEVPINPEMIQYGLEMQIELMFCIHFHTLMDNMFAPCEGGVGQGGWGGVI